MQARTAFLLRSAPVTVFCDQVQVRWVVPAATVPPLAAALVLLPSGPLRLAGWAVLGLACAALVASAGWPGSRHAWRWTGAGLALLVVSGVAASPALAPRPLVGLLAPSVLVHLLAYLPLLVGLFLLTEAAPRRPDPWALLDAAVIVVAVVAAGLLVVVDGRLEGLPVLALPLLDAVVIVSAAPLVTSRDGGASRVLLGAGLAALLSTDVLLLVGTAGSLDLTSEAGATLLLALLLVAVAALHPSAGRLLPPVPDLVGDGARPGRTQATPRRMLLLGTGLVGAPLLLLLSLLGLLPGVPRAVPLAAFGVFGLAALRLAHLVAELVRHEADLDAQRRFAAAFDRSPGGLGLVAVTGRDAGRLVEVNTSLAHLLGLPASRLVGTSVVRLVHPDDPGGLLRLQVALAEVASGRPVATPVATRLQAPGRPRWGVLDLAPLAAGSTPAAGSEVWAVLQVEDVTDRVDTEAQLARQARRDPLTGLANRLELLEVLRACLRDHAGGGEPVAVLLLDLDRFKLVNDTHGHAVGDELLGEVAARLRRLRVDTVARLGGDEFALLARVGAGEQLDLLLRRLHAVLEPLVTLSRGEVVVSASVGVVVHDRTAAGTGADDAEGLLRQADIAMYRSKGDGGRRHVVFGERLQAEVDHRHAIERELRAALTSGGLAVVYQPLVDLVDLRVVGHEALVRMVRRVEGVTVGPSEFLEVAEESGLVKGMGGFVMSTALGTAVRDPGGRTMAVNVSGRELAEPDFAARVLRRLARVGLAPDRLTVEVTENAVVPYLDGVVPQLAELRREGVRVALDDFGTGYSSLTHLRVLPVDTVKIDRSFVERVVTDGPDRRIVAAVTGLVDGLGLATVAEGIETRAQHDVVTALGCRYGQGYLYGRPAADLAAVPSGAVVAVPPAASVDVPAARPAPVAQPAEAGALKAQQYGFESRRGHAGSRRAGEGAASSQVGDLGPR